jgi:hypothetical protein
MYFNCKQDNFAVDEQHNVSDFVTTYQIIDIVINPATEIVTKCLPIDDQTVVVFALFPIQFTLTKNLLPIYRDWQKPHPVADTECHYHSGLRCKQAGIHELTFFLYLKEIL